MEPIFPLIIQIARGDRPADLLIRNARLINVFIGSIVETDIAVAGGVVVGFGPYEAEATVDLKGLYLAPGFIDAHVHIESSMLTPAQFARAVVTHGTTTVVADPHEIANVLGPAGLDYMLETSQGLPLNFYFTLPSCVPATHLETSGAIMDAETLRPYVHHPRFVALAEMMNFPGVISANTDVLAKIQAMKQAGKPLDGHAPGLTGRDLYAYLLPGINSDHECTTVQEAQEKLAAGMHIMVREGSGARNLDDLLPAITPQTARRMMWCTDDRHPQDLLAEGHIDSLVRRSIRSGLDPITALQMATLNPAEYFRLPELGAVAPGRKADFVVLDSLQEPVVRQVYCRGRLTAEDGHWIGSDSPEKGTTVPNTIKISTEGLSFRLPARGNQIRVIKTVPHQILTQSEVMAVRIIDDQAVSDPERDLLKIAVIERHHGTGRIGLGFISGFGLKRGALASTVAHDSHNIVVVGASDSDMVAAVAGLSALGGGLVVVQAGSIIAQLPLPMAGLMSDQPLNVVNQGLAEILHAAQKLGSQLPDPFMTLSFMALPVIPALKITDRGLVDVEKFEVVPLFVE